MTTIVKAYFERSGADTEIRRFDFDQVKVGNYNKLVCYVTQVFTDLQGKPFILSWKDDDNDKITFSSDQELTEAFSFANNGVFQLYIKIQDVWHDQASVIHPGVICNGCNVVLHGTRYKCLVCPNYDLCMTCEEKGLHTEHNMMALRTPSSKWVKLFPSDLRHLAGPYPSCRAHGRPGPLRRPHGPHIQQGENDRHGYQGHWRQMRQARRRCWRQMMGRTNEGNQKETKPNQNEKSEHKTDTETSEHNVSQSEQCAINVEESGGYMPEPLQKLQCFDRLYGRHGKHGTCGSHGVPSNWRKMRRSSWRWWREMAVQNNDSNQQEVRPNVTDKTSNNTGTEAKTKTTNGIQSEEYARNVDNYMLDHLDHRIASSVEQMTSMGLNDDEGCMTNLLEAMVEEIHKAL